MPRSILYYIIYYYIIYIKKHIKSILSQGLDGTWELRASRTFRKYLKGFLVLDVVLAILSWVELLFSFETFQMLRILRLARLWRIEALIQLISANIRSERAVLCIGISKKILWLMVFLHFVACYWVGLGRREGGWATNRPGATDLEQYSIAFHWALAQFHGTMELFPYSLEALKDEDNRPDTVSDIKSYMYMYIHKRCNYSNMYIRRCIHI